MTTRSGLKIVRIVHQAGAYMFGLPQGLDPLAFGDGVFAVLGGGGARMAGSRVDS